MKSLIFLLLALPAMLEATDTIISAWYKTNGTNWNITNQVMHVYYNSTYVWINANSIPAYTIGPWTANPNSPSAQNNTFLFTRSPSVRKATKSSTSLGAIGVWLDGVEVRRAI
jgi:hypothetical protein